MTELFSDIKDYLKTMIYLDEDWGYDVLALFVLQCEVAELLPAVFYVFAGGPFTSGKTRILNTLRDLTGGLLVENVSTAALARSMEHGRAVFFDEVDISRGRDYDEVRDALLRQGYRSDAARYIRYNAKAAMVEDFPIFGPKAATFRSALDAALESRGFTIPTSRGGPGTFELVVNGLWPKPEKLREEIEAWGKTARSSATKEDVKSHGHSADMEYEIAFVLEREAAANRESELAAIALLVSRIAGVRVGKSLRKAFERKMLIQGELERNEVQEVFDVLRTFAREDGFIRVRQSEVLAAINYGRRERREPSMSGKRLALVRREAGIKDAWLTRPGHATKWNVPDWFLEDGNQGKEGKEGKESSSASTIKKVEAYAI